MRVIRNHEPEINIRCGNCKTFLGVVETDVKTVRECDLPACEQAHYVVCPMCDDRVYINPLLCNLLHENPKLD